MATHIGEGNFSNVYKRNGRAVKEVFRKKLSDEDILEEIAIQQSADSENVVKIFSHAPKNKRLYSIIMELGKMDLLEYINDNFPLDAKSYYLVKGIKSGLQCLHDKGIIHRDLKIENIILFDNKVDQFRKRYIPKLTDFGFAIKGDIGEKHKLQGYIGGTVCLVAPEIIREEPFDHRSDIWSMGVVLNDMYTHSTDDLFNEYEDILKKRILVKIKDKRIRELTKAFLVRDVDERGSLDLIDELQ